jgi:FtsZ-interacting cell division protein YlmF
VLKDSFKKFMVYVGLTEDEYPEMGQSRSERPFTESADTEAFENHWAPQPAPAVAPRVSSVSVLHDTSVAPAVPSRPVVRPATPSSAVRPITTLAQDEDLAVLRPLSYEDSKRIGDELKARKALVIDLAQADADLSRRIVDFSSGVIYTLSGRIQKVGPHVYLLAPPNVRVSPEAISRLRERNFRPVGG